jgi:two-component system chemotaxis sensor kinase CheA
MNRKDPYQYFRVEARELSDALGRDLLALERAGAAPEIVARLLRHAHTLKGAARVMKLPAIADKAHAVEDRLAPTITFAGFLATILLLTRSKPPPDP